jgi:hypothetical protein
LVKIRIINFYKFKEDLDTKQELKMGVYFLQILVIRENILKKKEKVY